MVLLLTNKNGWKEGDTLYSIIHGQLGSNVIAPAKNSTNPNYVVTHKKRCVVSLVSILLLICIKDISGTKVDPIYNGLQIISSTLSYTQKPGVSNSDFGDAVNDQVLASMSQYRVFYLGEVITRKCSLIKVPPSSYIKQCQYLTKLKLIIWLVNSLHHASLLKTAHPVVPVCI